MSVAAFTEAPTAIDFSIPLAGRELVPFVSLEERAVSIRNNYYASLHAELDASEYRQSAGCELMAVKALLAHGEWLPWLKANFKFTAREAQRLIRCAEEATPDGRQRLEAELEARREKAKAKYDKRVAFQHPPAPEPIEVEVEVEEIEVKVAAVDEESDDDALRFFHNDARKWCEQFSDQTIVALIEQINVFVADRHEDIARFITQYRRGDDLRILDICERFSGAARGDDERGAVLDALKEIKVAEHIKAVRDGGRSTGHISVTAFCHWAISQVAPTGDVATFFAMLLRVETAEGQPAILQARDQLQRFAFKGRDVWAGRQAEIILRAWIAYRTGAESFQWKGKKLPTFDDLRAFTHRDAFPVAAAAAERIAA